MNWLLVIGYGYRNVDIQLLVAPRRQITANNVALGLVGGRCERERCSVRPSDRHSIAEFAAVVASGSPSSVEVEKVRSDLAKV